MIRCLKDSEEMAKNVITDETGCKSSLISVYTSCRFKITISTPDVPSVKKDQNVP